MDILIIGGTTFFGRDIVELALENEHKVTVFSRGNQRPAFWDRVEHIAGDRSDHADFAGKLSNQSFDVVVDNIAFNDNDVRSALEIFMGPEDPTNRCQFYFRRLLDGGPLILTNGGVYSTQPVYRRDLAQGYLLAMTSEKAVNQVYHFAQEKANRLIDWVQLAAEFLEVEADVVSIPAEVLQQSPFNYEEPWTYIGTLTLDLSKARTDLGFESTPVEVWLASTAKWYRKQGYKSDSSEDGNRQEEIAFAQKYRQLASQL